MTVQSTTIFGPNYTKSFFEDADGALAKELADTGILILDEFMNKETLQKLQREASMLKKDAFRSTSTYNVYIAPYDEAFADDSPRNKQFSTSKGCIPQDCIPETSALRTLYNSPNFKNFICKILNLDAVYPYADTLSSININYYDPGDALEWHFDNSDFTITLLVQGCKEGGEYEYFTDMRYTQDGEENYPLVEQCISGEKKPNSVKQKEGSLMIFRGNKSLHRVTEVLEGERVLVTLNFNTQPGVPLSEQSRKTFFGRTE